MAKEKRASELGFAAFLHLRDSTYLWNQDPGIAHRALASLAKTVEAATEVWQGRIGNFTGDHLLVLFPMADHAIRGVAEAIEKWEPQRRALCKALGAQLPDEYSLMVRAGIAHGHYRFLKVFSDEHVAGEAANRARRCEGASRNFFVSAAVGDYLKKQERIFVTQDVLNLVADKSDYWRSKRLLVEFKGYERLATGGLLTTPDHIVAVWPRTAAKTTVESTDAESLKRAAQVASRVEIADRLVAGAARPPSTGPSRSKGGLLSAIVSYEDALAKLPEDDLPSQRAEIHSKLGLAHSALSELDSNRRRRMDEALQEFQSAIELADADEEPDQAGAYGFNIAALRRRQAELVPPAERAYYLTDAVRSLRNVLQIPGFIANPTRHSLALGTLALVMGDQAEYLREEAREKKWTEVTDVLRKALSATTAGTNPHHYASLQSDLSNAIRMEARHIESRQAKEALLADGESRARDAAKALDAGAAPSRYANAQVNLGLVLLDRARLASRTEAMLALAEAADAFKEALKANDSPEYWHKRATILENLSLALQLQGGYLGGKDRDRRLAEARRTSEQALRIYKEIGHDESAARIARTLQELKDATADAT